MNTYNVYQGDKKVLDGVTSEEVTALTGVQRNKITQYINTGKIYHGKTGEFEFNYFEDELDKYPDTIFKEKWDNYRFKLNPGERRSK